KKTLMAGAVLISAGPACCNSAKRSTEIPPVRFASTTEGGRTAGPACVPKVIEPVMPTENELQLLPEKGKAKFLRVASLPGISGPNSESHCDGIVSTRSRQPSGGK